MIAIRLMTPDDISLGMRLKSQAGWNQLEADWRRFLAMQPDGCFVAEWEGTAAGTTATCVFGSVAWVAMVLVDEPFRGRGIGRALLEHALAYLDEQDVASVRLDATPLGQPLYERLRFVPQYTIVRYAGIPDVGQASSPAVTQVSSWQAGTPAPRSPLLALDRAVTNTDRRKFLERLVDERPEAVRCAVDDGELQGYMIDRPGDSAWQLGPCVASAEAGEALLVDAVVRHPGERVFLDVPEPNQPAIALAERLGLKVQRRLVRMCRGEPVCEDVSRLWASSGPELG